MTDTLKARDDKDVEDAVQWAVANDKALEIVLFSIAPLDGYVGDMRPFIDGSTPPPPPPHN